MLLCLEETCENDTVQHKHLGNTVSYHEEAAHIRALVKATIKNVKKY
jgi:hypothetical protein